MADRLVGTNIAPNDLVAKITGRARYAEDFRAEGMLFAKLLVSPMPHCQVNRIDASAALAMPGVEAVLTADEQPEGRPGSERALTNEPLYEGEPILAVAAVDETTAANAIDRIRVDLEPLPFCVDPLESLRPNGPNALTTGNTMREREMANIKWPQEVFDAVAPGELPMGETTAEWSFGDVEMGFEEADLVLDETIAHQSLTHHPLEPRSCMAFWQNGKLHIHVSTQSTVRTVSAAARAAGVEPEDVVMVAEYCGGGFGSKISGNPNMAVPALLSRKAGRPVMLRVTRAEENYFGRARPGFQARIRMGWRADGRVTALDMFIVQDNGSYGQQGDMGTAAFMSSLAYVPLNMRYRGISVFTNTPPRSAQRAPGGVQAVTMIEPLMERAAKALGIDRVEIRKVNAANHDSKVGPAQSPITSAFVREAIDVGADTFGWEELKQLSGRRQGSKVTGVGIGLSPFVGGSTGYDGLMVILPDGRLRVHQGIGNLGTHSNMDTARAAADVLGMPWDRCEVVWGDTSKHLPWSCSQAGSQTAHAHTRSNHVAALDAKRKLQELAARDLGGSPGDYDVGDERVFSRADRSRRMSFSRAAKRAIEIGGRYSGHEYPDDIHDFTVAAVQGLAGQGLVGVAKDTLPREGGTFSWVIGFARVEVDVETGHVRLVDYTASTDCGVVLNPRSLAAQLHGGGAQGFGVARSQKWVYDPQWGVPFTKGFHTAKPPTMLDVPLEMKWAAVNEPDPYNPVGVKGIGEPPIGAGAAAVACAIQDALGDVAFNRTPITTDMIMAALDNQPQPFNRLTAHV